MGKANDKQKVRANEHFRFSSAKNYIKFFVPGFAFRHDNQFKGKDKFVGRELQLRKLFLWLTSDSLSGSFLVTGYRGMGKSLLVNRVLHMISRPQKEWKELVFKAAEFLAFVSCFIFIVAQEWNVDDIYSKIGVWSAVVSGLCIVALWLSKVLGPLRLWYKTIRWQWGHRFNKNHLAKYVLKIDDGRDRKQWRVPIQINLGQEVLNERDVLGIIAQNVREKYGKFVKNKQNRPLLAFLSIAVVSVLSCFLTSQFVPFLKDPLTASTEIKDGISLFVISKDRSNFIQFYYNIVNYLLKHSVIRYITVLLFAVSVYSLLKMAGKWICSRMPYISTPYKAIQRLNNLSDRINANVNEDTGSLPKVNNNWLTISVLGRGKNKVYPIANVREIEQELQEIINSINDKNCCPRIFQIKFIIVFDELDKVASSTDRGSQQPEDGMTETPKFDASVEGFSGTMGYEARKRDILHLLANMKLFIATVRAKCVFISGHELYDASLADLSDREFAISSIFNGVLNVDSFLSPERDQNEVSSMTELYLATMLLPEDYIMKKMLKNADDNHVLKEELPSLRWYNEYLMEELTDEKQEWGEVYIQQREAEIHYAVEFLRYFAVYLAHVCNGSPKKISTYFEKYVRTEFDVDPLYDWSEILSFGKSIERNTKKQCVLWFDYNAQRFINFLYYIASPVMRAITNEVSHYGDKLLVTSSFILDQIYKYHGKGFSWRNLEQMPELLNANKNPELRDSMASLMEFLLQIHITQISFGIFQYKFHKQIAEEITYISMTSEEASAIFNFTLNESSTVKRYNTRLLDYYIKLSQAAPKDTHYHRVLERLHENLGDIYFMDEDYYLAIHEYRNALRYIDSVNINPHNVIGFLKCSLKIGMAYEYRRTFENAYMIYCQTINNLVHLRWIDERSIGLDYTSKWTEDWRVKQPLLVNYDVLAKKMGLTDYKSIQKLTLSGRRLESYKDPSDEELEFGKRYRRQFLAGVWDDIKGDDKVQMPEYSTTTDCIVSGLSSNFTPEKSDILQRLTVFEDIRYIYLAIIAKLFVIEKMELGGVSYSSIEVAEAEFLYLHSATNMESKFMISADFFHKMAEVMYYKNGYVTPLKRVDSLVSALYYYDCNILSLIDDYCFSTCGEKNNRSAIDAKENLIMFFSSLQFGKCMEQPGTAFEDKLKCMIAQYPKDEKKIKDFDKIIGDYIKYIKKPLLSNIESRIQKVSHCAARRDLMLKIGYKLPCNACRYAHRSLSILMGKLFVEENMSFDKEIRVLNLLYMTSRKHIRQSEMSLLADAVEQLGDIMLSCSLTKTEEFVAMSKKQHPDLASFNWNDNPRLHDVITPNAIGLLEKLTGNALSEVERLNILNSMCDVRFSKLDKSLLYYWISARFYEMASLNKSAAFCVNRMLKVIQDYLKVVGSSFSTDEKIQESVMRLCSSDSGLRGAENTDGQFLLVRNLFRHVVKYVGAEYDNYDLGEIHEYKWLFHLEHMDDVDLSRLSLFSDIKLPLLTAMDIKIRVNEYLSKHHMSMLCRDAFSQRYKDYIALVYNRIASPLRHDKTFKEEVMGAFMKAQVNKRILIDCLKTDIMAMEKFRNVNGGEISDYHDAFYQLLCTFLDSEETDNLASVIFKAGEVKSRLNLAEYLIHDSFVCLTSILSVLTPHNHLTTFPHSFLAEVYDLMWEWSKYYDMLYDLYFYRKNQGNANVVSSILDMVARNTRTTTESIEKLMKDCVDKMGSASVKDKTPFGYQYTRMLMSIRHDVDDATIHHIFTNVSAEMATKYYKMAKDVNNEGPAYKDMIMGMYVLDDDLRNDTCQSNLSDERYLWHCGWIDRMRDAMIGMYENSNINQMKNYEHDVSLSDTASKERLKDRFEDSPYLNSEY